MSFLVFSLVRRFLVSFLVFSLVRRFLVSFLILLLSLIISTALIATAYLVGLVTFNYQ
jgi:hypothetical protein